MNRLSLSIGLLSSALIAYQLFLMYLLSIIQWHHFAALIIALALLGFGASGTFLVIFRDWLVRHSDRVLPVCMLVSGVAMAVAVGVAQHEPFRFDSLRIFAQGEQMTGVVLTSLLFFIPFFSGALAIGLLFVVDAPNASRIYFANLVGSGCGGIAAILLMYIFTPAQLPGTASIAAIVAAVLVLPRKGRGSLAGAAVVGISFSLVGIFSPPRLHLSEYKDISRSLRLPDARVLIEQGSPFGFVQLVSSSALRYAPGLSLKFSGEIPVRGMVYNNGDWYGPLLPGEGSETGRTMEWTTMALPYVMRQPEDVLVLEARTGLLPAQSAALDVRRITAVEPHVAIVELLRTEKGPGSASPDYGSHVRWEALHPRTFLLTHPEKVDLIMLPLLGTFGGGSGLSALREEYTLTAESFRGMWDRLNDNGMICVSSWMDYPPRASLRVAATLVEMLSGAGIREPLGHLAAVRGWGTVTFLASPTPFTRFEAEHAREFCLRRGFDPVLLPDVTPVERTLNNALEDSSFFVSLDRIMTGDREALYREYPFAIRPPTDDRPFFWQFLRWGHMSELQQVAGPHGLPFLEAGYFVAMLTLIQVVVMAVVLILLPLMVRRATSRGRIWTIVYFGALGLGYMFVEMVLIQRFVLPLGNTILSFALVIGTMMVSSGAGSLWSSRLAASSVRMGYVASGVMLATLLCAVLLVPGLPLLLTVPVGARVVASVCLIAPLGFLMGMPFPLGLRFLAVERPTQVAWAWGVNGCLSVVSTSLATVMAVEVGFVAVQVASAGMYLLAAVACFVLSQVRARLS